MVELTSTLFSSVQRNPYDMAHLAANGFKVIICNRPDGEAFGQPTMDEMEAAANAAGMRFIRYPIDAATFPGDDLVGIRRDFDSGEKTLAFCRSGTRCANLWVMSRVADERLGAADHVRALGYDLSLYKRFC